MPTVTDQTLAVCSIRPGPWPPSPGTCVWCGLALEGRQRRWCGPTCDRAFTTNHNFQAARAAAIERDGCRCTSCGLDPEGVHSRYYDFWKLLDFLTGRPPRIIRPWDRQREEHAAWRAEHETLHAPWLAAQRIGDAWLWRQHLEVDHITPILGRHGTFGCHHHLEGLRTLCYECHLQETNRQFGRTSRRPAPQTDLFAGAP